jgi:hypothetical protein
METNNAKLYDGFGLFDSDTPLEAPQTPLEAPIATVAVKPKDEAPNASQSVLERLATIALPPGATRLPIESNRALLAYPMALLPQLSALTLFLSAGRSKSLVAFTTSRKGYAAAVNAKVPCFVGGEYIAIAHAAQNDRLWASHFVAMVNKKARNPQWYLSPQEATGVVYGLSKLSWSIGEVLDRLHAQLVGIEAYR